MGLFRQAAIDGRRATLHGGVTVHQPLRFRVMTGLMLLAAVSALGAAFFASFARKETASGWLVPERGIAEAFASPGTLLERIDVKLGEKVAQGEILGAVSSEIYGSQGALSRAEGRQLEAQVAELDAQIDAARGRSRIAAARAQAQYQAAAASLETLLGQKRLQEGQLDVAVKQLEALAPLQGKGFIARFEIDRRQQSVLALRQASEAIEDRVQEQRSKLAELSAARSAMPMQQAIDESQLRASRASLTANALDLAARSNSLLRAAVGGTVIAINMQPGETVKAGFPVISIAPPGRLGVELLLPTRSAGLVSVGQPVRLLVDAFPYQRYGSLTGTVLQIGRASLPPNTPVGPVSLPEPFYRLRVGLTQQGVIVAGRLTRLSPGMTVKASIVTDRRTILQWLFDPVLSVRETLAS